MGFEYDPAKSAQNKRKHGIDFETALTLWSDDALVEIPARVALVGRHCPPRRERPTDLGEAFSDRGGGAV
jgi:hypothetical protein